MNITANTKINIIIACRVGKKFDLRTTVEDIDDNTGEEAKRRKLKNRRGKTKNHYKYRGKYRGPRPNFARFMPSFDGLCDFCGGDNHFANRCKIKEDLVKERDDKRRHRLGENDDETSDLNNFCEYPLCVNPTTHLTKRCYTLHRICPMCLFRGHGPKQCNEFTVDQKRDAFRDHYRNGIFTHEADEINLQWGYQAKRKYLLPTTDFILANPRKGIVAKKNNRDDSLKSAGGSDAEEEGSSPSEQSDNDNDNDNNQDEEEEKMQKTNQTKTRLVVNPLFLLLKKKK